MAMARRDVLALGAAVAVSMATSSCRGSDVDERPRAGSPPAPTVEPAVPPAAAFAGQPEPGHLYYGACLPRDRSLTAWERELGSPLALNRSYFTPDHNEVAQLVSRCRDDLARHRLPHVSMKPQGTWAEIASGDQDEWLTSMLRPLAEQAAPIFFTLHHEPEDDSGPPGMAPADFVAMQGRLIGLAATLAPQVTIVPILQHWTFDPVRDDIDPTAWIVPEAAVQGVDIYNMWSHTNGREWRTFASLADEVLRWVEDTPLAIGEYGCREDPDHPGLASDWLREAAAYARQHNVVSMAYFNSSVGAVDGTWALSGETEQTFGRLLGSNWVARPG
jgi:hypothetical protein